MFKITLPADRAEPDMYAVASAFGINIDELENDISIGTISRWFEVGEGDEDNKPTRFLPQRILEFGSMWMNTALSDPSANMRVWLHKPAGQTVAI